MLTIAILAIDNCIHSTVTGAHDIFSIAATHPPSPSRPGKPFCDVRIVLPDRSPVRTFNGIEITGHHYISEDIHYDIIITPALIGDIAPLLDQQDITSWIGRQHADGACICSVCASAFIVAAAGLMDGRQATTHWALAGEFRKRFPEVRLTPEKMIVDEGDIISAGGVTAYLDLCLHIINRFGSHELASSISRTLLIDHGRRIQKPYSSSTFSKNHGDSMILKAQKYLEDNFIHRISMPEVASTAGLEERTFNRRFKRATGDTPTGYIQNLRIEAARRMLETTREPVDSITREVGYENPSSFRRLFKQNTGLSPSEYRQRFSLLIPADI